MRFLKIVGQVAGLFACLCFGAVVLIALKICIAAWLVACLIGSLEWFALAQWAIAGILFFAVLLIILLISTFSKAKILARLLDDKKGDSLIKKEEAWLKSYHVI